VLDILDKVCYHKKQIPPKNVSMAVQGVIMRTLHHQKVSQRNRILGTLFHGFESYATSVLLYFYVKAGLCFTSM